MMKSKAKNIICLVLICASVLAPVGPIEASENSLSLSAQPFTKRIEKNADQSNSIRAYLAFAIKGLLAKGTPLSDIVLEDIKTIQANDRRISIRAVSFSGESLIVTAAVNGSIYQASATSAKGELSIDITPLLAPAARFFPGTPGIPAVPALAPEIVSLANTILQDKAYSIESADQADLDLLSRTVVDLLKNAFFEEKMFNSITGAGNFFQGREGVDIDTIPASEWSKDEALVRQMVEEYVGKHPAIAQDLTLICRAIGKIFYMKRGYGAYSRSEFFYSLAHTLSPNDFYSYNDWAWSLFHCGKTQEAREHINILLDLYPSDAKLIVEQLYITLREAEDAIRAFERQRLASMPIDEFYGLKASVQMKIQEVLSLSNKRFGSYPRALAAVGKAYHLLARLHLTAHEYEKAVSRPRKERAASIVESIGNIAMSGYYLKRAREEADLRGNDLHNHTRNMYHDLIGLNAKNLDRCRDALFREGYLFIDKIKMVMRRLNTIVESSRYRDMGQSTDMDVAARGLRDYCGLQQRADAAMKEKIGLCTESDVESADDFLVSAARAAIGSASGSEVMAQDLASFWRSNGIDAFGLAVVFIRLNLLSKEDPSYENIMKYMGLLGIAAPSDQNECKKRIANAFSVMGLTVPSKVQEVEERDLAPRKPINREMLDRSTLVQSIDPSQQRSLIARARFLAGRFALLEGWQEYKDMQVGYISGLKMRGEKLAQSAEAYAAGVADYLAKERAKGLSVDERKSLRAKGEMFTQMNADLWRQLDDYEKLEKKRFDRVISIIYDQVVEKKTAAREFRARYSSLGVDWISMQLALLDDNIAALGDIGLEGATTYLLYDAYSDLVRTADDTVSEIKLFGNRFVTFARVLAAIDDAASEAEKAANFFKTPDALREFTDRLDEARRGIFRHVLEGQAYETLGPEDKEFYGSIAARADFLKELRDKIIKTLDGAVSAAPISDMDAVKSLPQEVRESVLKNLGPRIFSRAESGNTVMRLCNLSASLPVKAELGDAIDRINGVALVLYSLKMANAPIVLDVLIKNFAVMNTAAPGSVDESKVTELAMWRNRAITAEIEIGTIALFAPDSVSRFREASMAATNAEIMIKKVVGEVYGSWYRSIGVEISALGQFVGAWVDNWRVPGLDDKKAGEFKEAFKAVVDILKRQAADDTSVADMVIKFGRINNIIQDIVEASYEDLIIKPFKQDMIDGVRHVIDTSLLEYENGVRVPEKLFSVKMMIVLRRSQDDVPLGATAFLFDITKAEPMLYPVELPLAGLKTERSELIKANDHLATFAGSVDAIEKAYGAPYKGMRMDHLRCAVLIEKIMRIYKVLLKPPALVGAQRIGSIESVDLRSIANFANSILNKETAEDARKVFETDEIAKSFVGLRDRIKKAVPPGKDLSPAEQAKISSIDDFSKAYMQIKTSSFFDIARSERFMHSFFVLLEKASGKKNDVPRPSLTIDAGIEVAHISSIYPPVKDYSGVYFDPGDMSFGVRPGEDRPLSRMLCDALNAAFDAYVNSLGNGHSLSIGEEWHGLLDGILEGLKRRGEIEITVALGLPTNSLSVSDTAVFDRKFVEYVMATGKDEEASRIILGERIMHELGLISMMSAVSSESEDVRAVIQHEEEEQTYKDAVFHARIFSSRPDLEADMELFTGRMVRDEKRGTEEKFSHVFNSAELYRNMKRWASLVGVDAERAKNEIRVFIKDVLDRVSFRSPYVRLFPALGRSAPEGNKKLPARLMSTDLVIAISGGRYINKQDAAVLDSLGRKDTAFQASKRRIVISSALIPACQKNLVAQINKHSRDIFDNGLSQDLIEILPFDRIDTIRRQDGWRTVVLLEEREAASYAGDVPRLVFSTKLLGEDPAMLNGLVAAGRAVAYREMESLRRILKMLAMMADRELPSAAQLEKMLDEDSLRSLPVIILPPVNVLTGEIGQLNRAIMKLLQYA